MSTRVSKQLGNETKTRRERIDVKDMTLTIGHEPLLRDMQMRSDNRQGRVVRCNESLDLLLGLLLLNRAAGSLGYELGEPMSVNEQSNKLLRAMESSRLSRTDGIVARQSLWGMCPVCGYAPVDFVKQCLLFSHGIELSATREDAGGLEKEGIRVVRMAGRRNVQDGFKNNHDAKGGDESREPARSAEWGSSNSIPRNEFIVNR